VSHRILNLGDFSISVVDGWEDITATLEDAEAPLTIANPVSGIGALQFSPAIYQGGQLPQVMSHDLSALLNKFADGQGLNDPFDRLSYPGEITVEGASFRSGDDLIRVWYVSDGRNVMLVTYVCDWSQRDGEASEREMAVRSLRFT
jgi:hypothetical protein